jgi:HAMP domain-containing protein
VSLRFRLWLVIGVLALLPLVVGAVVASVLVPDVQQTQSTREALAASAAVRAQLQASCRLAGVSARSLALDAAATSPRDALNRTVDGTTVQYAALLSGNGRVVASAGTRPAALADPAQAPRCSTGGAAGALLTERVGVSGPLAEVTGAVVATAVDLGELRASLAGDAMVALVRDGRTVASTDAARAAAFAELRGRAGADGSTTTRELVGGVAAQEPGVPWDVVVADERPDASDIQRFVVVAGLLLALAGLLPGWWIARSLTQPLDELGQVAERVAKGELDLRVPVRSVDEVGRLGTRFNDMTAKLRDTISELEGNRDKMAESLARMGATLKNTHDLEGLLKLVLDTAVAVSGAHHGVALVLDGPTFKLAAQHDMEDSGLVLPRHVVPGSGVLGSVVTGSGLVRGRIGTGPADLHPSPDEPGSGHLLAIALRRGTRVVGLLGLYRRADEPDFSAGRRRRCAPWPVRRASPWTTSCCTRRPSGSPSPTHSPASGTSATSR